MRIVCDSCSTKYSISDEKVRGKVFKIRCKNCSHVIIVRGDGADATEEAAPSAGPPEGVWYIVRGGQQDGPYTEDDIRGFVESGDVNSETYTWREGFADWVPLASAEGLGHLVEAASEPAAAAIQPAPEQSFHDEGMIHGQSEDFDDDVDATKVVDSSSFRAAQAEAEAEAEAEAAASRQVSNEEAVPQVEAPLPLAAAPEGATVPVSLVGGGLGAGYGFQGGSEVAAAAADETPSFSGLSGLAGSSSLDAAFNQEPAPQVQVSGGVQARNGQQLVGSRNEDSVLFSLNSLGTSDAEQVPEHSNTEASGLIDIRALQASNAAVSGGRDGNASARSALSGGGPAPEPAISVPAMMPMGTRKSNWPLYTAIGGVFLLTILLVASIVGIIVYKGGDDAEVEDVKVATGNDPSAVDPSATNNDPLAGALADKGEGTAEKAEEAGGEGAQGEGAEGEGAEGAEGEGAEGEGAKGEGAAGEGAEGEGENAAVDDGGQKEAAPKAVTKPKTKAEKAREREAREKRVADKAKERKAEAPAAETKKKPGGKDAIDDILSDIGGKKKPPTSTKTPEKPPAGDSEAKKSLSKSEVQRVIRGAYGRVSACNSNQADKKSGTVMVRFTIQPSGSVGGAQVTGGFAGTPVGGCISRVVRSLRFPRSGRPLTITFPFRLR